MGAFFLSHIWNKFFFTGFSGESLGLVRLYFGFGLIPFHIIQFESVIRLDPTGAQFYYLEPMWHFALLGIDYHFPLFSLPVFVLLIGATVSMALGKWTRLSIFVVIVCIFYLKGVRDSFTGDVHHRYLVPIHMLFLLLVSRCGDAHSYDERARTTPSYIQEWEASWPLKAMQVYCASFYVWSIIAKLRVAGWAWFADGARLQEILLKRSVTWGVTETGRVVSNPLAFQLAQYPDLLFGLGLITLVIEAGFPFILLMPSVKARILFLSVVTAFHIANFVLLYVGFLLLPIAFIIFFDLGPVHAWVTAKLGTSRPAHAVR